MRSLGKNLTVTEKLLKYRKIDEITGCWLWTKGTDSKGYGKIMINNKLVRVHRVSYELFIGPLKESCLHKLECISKCCFNPEHLYDGDHYDNMQDRLKAGNHFNANKTHCNRGHEFTPENTIIKLTGSRNCKICNKEWTKIGNEKKRLKKMEIK